MELPKVENYLPADGALLRECDPLGLGHYAEQVVENSRVDHETVPLRNELHAWSGGNSSDFYAIGSTTQRNLFQKKRRLLEEVDSIWAEGACHRAPVVLAFLAIFSISAIYRLRNTRKNSSKRNDFRFFVHIRKPGTQGYVSKGLINGEQVEPIRVDIPMVNLSDELDCEALKQWQPQFAKLLILEDGVYKVGREVEKCPSQNTM